MEEKEFKKIFNCLIIISLDRNNPLENKLDDIINNIGLLRTSLIFLQIKFEINNKKSPNDNNSDIIYKNKCKRKYIRTKAKYDLFNQEEIISREKVIKRK